MLSGGGAVFLQRCIRYPGLQTLLINLMKLGSFFWGKVFNILVLWHV